MNTTAAFVYAQFRPISYNDGNPPGLRSRQPEDIREHFCIRLGRKPPQHAFHQRFGRRRAPKHPASPADRSRRPGVQALGTTASGEPVPRGGADQRTGGHPRRVRHRSAHTRREVPIHVCRPTGIAGTKTHRSRRQRQRQKRLPSGRQTAKRPHRTNHATTSERATTATPARNQAQNSADPQTGRTPMLRRPWQAPTPSGKPETNRGRLTKERKDFPSKERIPNPRTLLLSTQSRTVTITLVVSKSRQ